MKPSGKVCSFSFCWRTFFVFNVSMLTIVYGATKLSVEENDMILCSEEARCHWKMQMQAGCLSTFAFVCRYRSSLCWLLTFLDEPVYRKVWNPGPWTLPRFLVHCFEFRRGTTYSSYIIHKRFEHRCSSNDSAALNLLLENKYSPSEQVRCYSNISLVTSEEELLHTIHYLLSTITIISLKFSIDTLKSEQLASAP